jgi:uncharacterized protein
MNPPNPQLNEAECRVLGALIEKEITTPEYYPLSLNALVNACNQKSNRDPVMNLDEDTVRAALRSLSEQQLARSAASDSRVTKYEHRVNELFNFHRNEIAVICVLLLRGPQTPGELRTRSERLYAFEDLEGVHSALNLLQKREPPLVSVLPRQPGTKESRYAHLLSLTPAVLPGGSPLGEESEATSAAAAETSNRWAALESQIERLRSELVELREQFAEFRRQFQ